MPTLPQVLNQEIRRLARSEARSVLKQTKRLVTEHRRTLAALKRKNKDQERKIAFLEARERERVAQPVALNGGTPKGRFSPRWLAAHRRKLNLSAQDYARLAGVSALSIYAWEKGKSKPRAKQVAVLSGLRSVKKREAVQRLELLGDKETKQKVAGKKAKRKAKKK